MKTLHISIIIGLAVTLLILGAGSAFASVELDAYLPINGHPVTPIFKFSKTIKIDYPSESKLETDLAGKNITVAFTENSDNNTTIKSFMEQINHNIATQVSTTSTITHLTVQYVSIISGNDKQATIYYLVTLRPTLANYVLKSGNDNVQTVLDLSWMDFNMSDPIIVTTKQYGNLEINFPLGVIQNQVPNAYHILEGTTAENLLNLNLIDAKSLVAYPIDKWNTFFDPTYTLTETAGYGYEGQKAAVTGFLYGQNDLYQVYLKDQTTDMNFTVDSKYHLTTVEKAISGTIDVEGHANAYMIEDEPVISTMIIAHAGYTGCPGCLTPDQSLFRSVLGLSLVGMAVIGFWIFYFRRFRE